MSTITRHVARVLFIAVAMSANATITSTALAQDDVATQMARERFQEGVRYYDQKQYEKARAAFLQAYALKKHPAVLLNLAQSELRAGHEADAAKHFSQYLREAGDSSAGERSEAEKGLAASKVKVAEYAVTVEYEGAEVYVDGTFEGRAPLPGPVYLTPGSHSLEARKDGKTATLSVTATAGQQSTAALTFSAPSTAGTPPATGPMTPPPSGGGMAPPPSGSGTQPPPSGDGGSASGSIGFDSSEEREPFFTWASHSPVAWIGGGLTVVGLAGGIGFALSSSSNYDAADSLRSQILTDAQSQGISGPCGPPAVARYAAACQKFQDRVDSGDSQKTLSTVSFVVAGVAAAGTVGYYFLDSKKKKSDTGSQQRRIAIVPVAAPGYGGLGLVGNL
ncbi:MAG: PEGA domain-containing protein [Polyangiaceae bacterium]